MITFRPLLLFVPLLVVLTSCQSGDSDKTSAQHPAMAEFGYWNLAGLNWKNKDYNSDVEPSFVMEVDTGSVTFSKNCTDHKLSVKSAATVAAGKISLLEESDTSCLKDGSEIWKIGVRLTEFADGNTMKLYYEPERDQGFWLWKRIDQPKGL